MLPHNDPTLLFINSGMCQFKPAFLGTVDPNTPLASLTRVANSQKCIRAGGKHNDLDDVGKDTYHHTFFEMLGNWSFGDYFKKESIDWSYELLVNIYGLDPSRMYATYFEGDEELGIPADLEARDLWLNYFTPEHVIPGNKADNFWEMGNVGPCGPCSELHYDRIGGRSVPELVNMDDPDVIEVWNLVFMQFSREADGGLKPLPNKHIDTGMGFERLVSILQNKPSNYDTDVFLPIFQAIFESPLSSPAHVYTGLVGARDSDGVDMAYRVVADHIRNVCVAIADGIRPGNTGRHYVIKRILRRGIRYANTFLGAETGFLSSLVPVVVASLGPAFPELVEMEAKITAVIRDEEISFAKTLGKGMAMFHKFKSEAEAENRTVISGTEMFTLYDTFGFPEDLTAILAEETGFTVDLKGFEDEMEAAKNRSRAAQSQFKTQILFDADQIVHLQTSGVPPTDDSGKYHLDAVPEATVRAICSGENFLTETSASTDTIALILDSTTFYAESGGQVFDIGEITTPDMCFEVMDTKAYAGYVLHIGTLKKGEVKVGGEVQLEVDYTRRRMIAPNHSCTHMLNFALRKVLGADCDQAGSLVDENRLRFDYNFGKPLTGAQAKETEVLVNSQIMARLPVYTKSVPLEDAQKISSLRAMFGEKYPDPVRVVAIGKDIETLVADPTNPSWFDYSVEFCGGTHLASTDEASKFVIISEEGIAKGIRRIVAVTGDAAGASVKAGEAFLAEIAKISSLPVDQLAGEVARLRDSLGQLQNKLPYSVKEQAIASINALGKKVYRASKATGANFTKVAVDAAMEAAAQVEESGNTVVVVNVDVALDSKALKQAVTDVLAKHTVALCIFSVDSDKKKMLMYTGVHASLQGNGFDAKTWLCAVLGEFGGRGGGKPLMSQGQCPQPESIEAVIEMAKSKAM